MTPNADELQSLPHVLDELRHELSNLRERVEELEARHTAQAPVSANGQLGSAPAARMVDERQLAIITAAVAAYLGIEPRIRQIRLVGGTSWAQQGRVTIQASHALPARHG